MIRDAIFIDETNRKTRPVEFKESGIIVEGLLVGWHQITISLGGNRHELLFFKFPQHNLYVRLDPELKKFLRNLKLLELSSVIDIGRKRKVIEISLVLALVFIVVLFFMRLPWIHAKVVDGAVELLPYETEREIGKAINEKVDFSSSHPREAEIETALKKILAPLVNELPSKFQNLDIGLNNSSDPNAFATPGGFIRFNLGFLKTIDSCSELYGVAAHEMAHITERHSLKALAQSLSYYAVFSLVVGDIPGLIAVILQNAQNLYSLSFSRDMESQADAQGLKYLANIGYDHSGLVSFFQRLQKNTPKLNPKYEKFTSFLSTHPLSSKRIAALKEMSESLEIQKNKVHCDYGKIKPLL